MAWDLYVLGSISCLTRSTSRQITWEGNRYLLISSWSFRVSSTWLLSWKTRSFLKEWSCSLKKLSKTQSRSFRFSLYIAYNLFLLCDNTTLTFDHRPWKTIGIFLSSWLSIVLSCMILELTVNSVSCLQCFPTMWQYDLDLWPSTLKKQ